MQKNILEIGSGQGIHPIQLLVSCHLLPFFHRLQVKEDAATDTKCKEVILLLIQRLDKAPFDLERNAKKT